MVLFNYAMVGDDTCTGFTQFFFFFFFKDSCNKQHDGIYVNGLTCYMVLFNYAMLSGTTLWYWICTGFFFVCVCHNILGVDASSSVHQCSVYGNVAINYCTCLLS